MFKFFKFCISNNSSGPRLDLIDSHHLKAPLKSVSHNLQILHILTNSPKLNRILTAEEFTCGHVEINSTTLSPPPPRSLFSLFRSTATPPKPQTIQRNTQCSKCHAEVLRQRRENEAALRELCTAKEFRRDFHRKHDVGEGTSEDCRLCAEQRVVLGVLCGVEKGVDLIEDEWNSSPRLSLLSQGSGSNSSSFDPASPKLSSPSPPSSQSSIYLVSSKIRFLNVKVFSKKRKWKECP